MKKLLFSAVSLDIGGIENALVNLLNYLARTDKYEITLFLEKKEGIFLDKIDKKIQICVYCPNDSKVIILRKGINFIKQTMFRMKYILSPHLLWQELLRKIVVYGYIVNICKCLIIISQNMLNFLRELKQKTLRILYLYLLYSNSETV